jgi:large subunit ribosomal protein L5
MMEAATEQAQAAPPPRLRDQYRNEVVPELVERFKYGTVMDVPRVEKITLNMGIGDGSRTASPLEAATEQLGTITGQRPSVRRARKSIAAFKIRSGYPVGVMVTLRNRRMYEFLDRLVTIALPRVRDFRGISGRAFDGRGNYNVGVKEQIIFPELDYDKIDTLRGLNISITTTAKNDEECRALLTAFKFPFKT